LYSSRSFVPQSIRRIQSRRASGRQVTGDQRHRGQQPGRRHHPAGATSTVREARIMDMLLSERFKLNVRRENKEIPVYVLVVVERPTGN
jgi:hypothetical protein